MKKAIPCRGLRRSLPALLCGFVVAGLLAQAELSRAEGDEGPDIVTATVGLYTFHVNTGEEYNAYPAMFGLEWEFPSRWGIGGTYFLNSFSQPCGYVYGERRFVFGPDDDEGFFLKITFGVIYGYKPPYENAVPLNYGGFSPGLVPIVGYKHKRVSAQAVIFGALSGAVVAVSYDIWK